jgi:ubiquinol-cytochrome c reductase cytochrome b subunit
MKSLLKNLIDAFEDRTGLIGQMKQAALHKVPPGAKWLYVFGSATLFAFFLQVFTGIILATTYVPSSGQAYDSLNFITNEAAFGHVVRGLHYFGASAMIILIGLHTIRVFLTGSYKYPREVNWLTGALLMPLVLGMAFTGQLLRWDQNGVWGVMVAAEQAGRTPFIGKYVAHFILAGDTVGGATLTRFYALHVFIIPGLIFLLIGLHLYLVLRNGISEPPRSGHPVNPLTYRAEYHEMLEREGRPFWPDAAWRDVVFGFAMIVVVFALAWFVGPPALGNPPNPSLLHAVPRPDWYFLWYFALFALMPPSLESLAILSIPVVLGILFLCLPFINNKGERSPLRRPWAVAFVLATLIMIGTLWHLGVKSPWSPDFSAKPLPAEVVRVTSGPAYEGAILFHQKGCEYCHNIDGYGGHRGPNLSYVADFMTEREMKLRIMNGRGNMPAFAAILKPQELADLLAFLETRHRNAGLMAKPVVTQQDPR